VLTAAHVLDVSHLIGAEFNGYDISISPETWIPHANWNGDIFNGYDIGLVRLDRHVTDIFPARRNTANNELGLVGTLVGYGLLGTGLTGATEDYARRAGQNVFDINGSAFTNPLPAHILLPDFDNPNNPTENRWGSATPLPLEYCATDGDSGGGWFIDFGEEMLLAGVHSFSAAYDGINDSDYGDVMGLTAVSAFNAWIDGIIGTDHEFVWSEADGGYFFSENAWTVQGSLTNVRPGIATDVSFRLNDTYTVELAPDPIFPLFWESNKLEVEAGDVTLDLHNDTYSITTNVETDGTLNIRGDGDGSLQARNLSIGHNTSGVGSFVEVRQARLSVPSVVVGRRSRGHLRVLGGGEVLTEELRIGATVWAADSTATVDGAGALVDVAHVTTVASLQTAGLTVTNGARFESGIINVGDKAPGLVSVSSGGMLDADALVIGFGDGGINSLINVYDGAVNVTGTVTVGFWNRGLLDVIGGGTTLVGTNLLIGDHLGTDSTVEVDGAGSLLDVAGTTFVADDQRATLTVSNEGRFESGVVNVGNNATGTVRVNSGGEFDGNALVVGFGNGGINSLVEVIGGELRVAGSATVGFANRGHLSILGDGKVEVGANLTVGDHLGTDSTVTVDGAGALLDVGGNMIVGDEQRGVLNIRGGANVEVSGGTNVPSTGTLNLQGGTLRTGVLGILGGSFNWSAGTLAAETVLRPLVNSSGVLSPGSNLAGATSINGNYTQLGAGTLKIDIGGASPGDTHDSVYVVYDAEVAGQLQLSTINGFVPAPGDTYTVFEAGGLISGEFSNVSSGQRLATTDGPWIVHRHLWSFHDLSNSDCA
jgi:T5SS/PEP-CTERM-associated repeat protein